MNALEELQSRFFKAVIELRRLQKLYWDTRAFTVIDKVKKQEKYVDRLVDDILEENAKIEDKKCEIWCTICLRSPVNCKCDNNE